MSDSKQNQNKWASEVQRDERRARLATMKARDGGKKPISTSSTPAKIITAVILVLAILGGTTWWAINVGLPQRMFPALTVGKVNISAAEFSLNYRMYLSQFSIDPTTESGKSYLNTAWTSDSSFATTGDYFKDQVAQQIQQYVIMSENAKTAGITLDAADTTEIASIIANLDNNAKAESATMTTDNYLIKNFGVGVDISVVKSYLERTYLADKYSSQMLDSFTFTDSELQTYYDAHTDDYDIVDYRSFTFKATVAEGATAPTAEATAEAKAKADAMLAAITDQESFKILCIANAAEADISAYTTTDKSLTTGIKKAEISDTARATWLFAAERKAGNTTVISTSTDATVVYFVSRRLNTDPGLVDVRHLLIAAAKATATTEEISAAKAKAESLLAEFKAGTATEDSFTALTKANSEDPGVMTNEGLYTDITPSSGYVAEFLNWAVDPARKPGDTGIVQTDFGFHIMYFVQMKEIVWHSEVKSDLIMAKYEEYMTAQKPNFPYSVQSFGMGLVK